MTTQKEFFDNAARQFHSNAILVPGASHFRNVVIDRAMRRMVTPLLQRFKGLNILEVGCGIGRWTTIMAEENSVVGVDVSRFMITMAKDSCRGKSCSFVVADVSFLPFRENTFDLVFSVTVLQHVLDEEKFTLGLSGMARCGKSHVLIVEEMWSIREIVLQNVYCPTRILPFKSYIRKMRAVGLHPRQFQGVTPGTLTVQLTLLLASRPNILESNLTNSFKSSQLLSRVVHFIMGIGMLPSVLAPLGYYNPRFSLHTMLIADKMG